MARTARISCIKEPLLKETLSLNNFGPDDRGDVYCDWIENSESIVDFVSCNVANDTLVHRRKLNPVTALDFKAKEKQKNMIKILKRLMPIEIQLRKINKYNTSHIDIYNPAIMTRSAADYLMHSTIRLECSSCNGNSVTGTGFFYRFDVSGDEFIPVIITNEHVIAGCSSYSFVFTLANDKNEPVIGSHYPITLSSQDSLSWTKHPDDNIDLALMPVKPLVSFAESQGVKLFYSPLNQNCIPTHEQLTKLSGIENIIMIGYPNGIWDGANNMPIIRRGITATSPKLDYEKQPIFLIDCACIPGSSGSPVLIFDQGPYSSNGSLIFGSRLFFLGVLFASPQMVAQGQVKSVNVVLAKKFVSYTDIPSNLGVVVKAHLIEKFRTLLLNGC
ncbi:hypothetical protein P9112_010138 [Eukaryota sp. TZLM1-RC]